MQQEKNIKTTKSIWLLIVSLISIIAGIYILFNPETALMASAMIVGIGFMVMGCGYLLEYRQSRSYMYPVIGVLDILIGLILLTNLGVTAISMPIILGFWCLFVGVTQFIGGLQLRAQQSSWGMMTLLTGLVGIIFGILLFLYPVFGIFTITFLLGTYLVIYGAMELGRYFKM